MRKILILLLALSLLLAGCSEETPKAEDSEVQEVSVAEEEPTQEELNDKLKREAIEADFVKVNGGEVEKDTRLTATGEVTVVMEEGLFGEFTLTTTEGEGYGIYTIWNMATNDIGEVTEGDYVQVWGTYEGKDDAGMPKITATIIEKIDQNEEVGAAVDETEKADSEMKIDFQIEAEENAKQFPADSVATFEGEKFKGMDYYYKGTIVDIVEIDNNVGDPSSWLVESDRGYLMPIQHEYFKANIGDKVEVWGTLSGNMYDFGSKGYEGIIDRVGSMHAMIVSVNGEMQY